MSRKKKETLNFVIDVDPIIDFEEEQRNVPLYTVSHDYTSGKEENKNGDSRKVRSSQKCWNCNEEGHNLQSCEAPRNHSMIQKNRKAFIDAKDRRGESKTPKRYHEQNEQKYANFKPGVISKRLRRALGLRSNQLPRHIYNMRHLGYPPGWLLEAQVLPSTIKMYDETGERVPDPDDEEGEIESVHIKYNVDLIVDYPGFNVPPESNVIEEANVLNAPLMREEHSKELMIEEMLKKGQQFELKPKQSEGSEEGECDEDMEAEEIPELVVLPPSENCHFVPPLPLEELPPPPPIEEPPPPKESGEGSEGEAGEEWTSADESNHSEKKDDPTPFGTPTASPFANLGKVKSMSLGTPILKSASPYSKVPSYEKFRQGMSEVLNFENLPGSTGTYDKMLKVLEKVRNLTRRN